MFFTAVSFFTSHSRWDGAAKGELCIYAGRGRQVSTRYACRKLYRNRISANTGGYGDVKGEKSERGIETRRQKGWRIWVFHLSPGHYIYISSLFHSAPKPPCDIRLSVLHFLPLSLIVALYTFPFAFLPRRYFVTRINFHSIRWGPLCTTALLLSYIFNPDSLSLSASLPSFVFFCK